MRVHQTLLELFPELHAKRLNTLMTAYCASVNLRWTWAIRNLGTQIRCFIVEHLFLERDQNYADDLQTMLRHKG